MSALSRLRWLWVLRGSGQDLLALISVRDHGSGRAYGAKAGSMVSMSMLRYTGFFVPTLSRILWIMPGMPPVKVSLLG